MLDIEQLAKAGELFDERYKLIKPLSTDGGTADVWLAIDVNTRDNPELMDEENETNDDAESGMMVAIKIYRPKNALDIEGEQRFRDEYKIVHNCRHTNLLQPTNFSIFNETPYLELPYCKNGSSEKLIGKQLPEKDIWQFIYDVASGLSYLHACRPPIIHQDVKPANVLIDDNLNYAITDFGISSQSGGKHGYYSDEENSGTMAYMAPERFSENYKPSAPSDIWAFGATLYEILAGEVPFNEAGGRNQLSSKTLPKPLGKNVGKDLQKLVFSCLSQNPSDRPTANQIIQIADKHLKSGNRITRRISLLLLAAISAGIIYHYATDGEKSKPMPPEQRFDTAISLLDDGNAAHAQDGVSILDSLAHAGYVPAMYELARTYGWYSDSVSLKRKQALEIEYYKNGASKYMPVYDKYNDKARELFAKIIDADSTADPELKAQAAYRLATYCTNKNDAYGQNFKKARQYLMESKKYALECNDSAMIEMIDRIIPQFDEFYDTEKPTADNNQ